MASLIPEITDAPGTHVLVIGVSEYKHFDDGADPTAKGEFLQMSQLSAASRSASEFAAWIKNERSHPTSPLSSLRVLLSPSPGEVIDPDIAALLNGDFSATTQNVRQAMLDFKTVCDLHEDNVLIVYVAGHGVQVTKTGSLLLLHDCGSPGHLKLLEGALDVAGMHAAFNHPNTAQTQFWFADACRQTPAIASRFETLDGALSFDEPQGTADASAMFLAATTGTQAFARVDKVTLFNEALLSGLRGGIVVEPNPRLSNEWHVSTHGLVDFLRPRVKALAEAENAEQTVDSVVRIADSMLHQYAATPSVDISINLDPAAAHPGSQGVLANGDDQTIAQTADIWPLTDTVEAGIYKLEIDTSPAFKNYSNFLKVLPQLSDTRIDVT